ncbi:MAG TPA: nucleoside phosphorylase [Flavobacteriaceae bacterium]|nr:nucleoside phosphorylase [Flavobacteriaceae bacterium]MCB9213165.1 nucleoside phosphorylase [Alteromonas sp.]HPF10163.1 nucleoside phosphorylase [Flavobacteriaceae bacterium]HQU21647.1 nucleoside phosphorylase [Flavobacteriaceae bacterium]HQU65800.1 nucleoside phosphorylase [Flavobacteriaceae bacterium]
MSIAASELILNPNGSIYHLHLKPGEVASTVITVGDPDRVELVSCLFDSIEVRAQHREFKTHTGTFCGKRFTVISTGIGPDNIDIVLNELDALVNIDFATRTINKNRTSLQIVRVGTSGALQPEIPVDSVVASTMGIGFDNLLHFYGNTESIFERDFSEAFIAHTQWNPNNAKPYAITADAGLLSKFASEAFLKGITTTNVGFYGPQGRVLRMPLYDAHLNEKIASFRYQGKKITNLEMETAAIYGMSKLLGHQALSLNAILANRANGTFSSNPEKAVQKLIELTLGILGS